MSKPTTKAFDAVQMMRDARAAMSATITSMSLDEQNEWLHSNRPTDPTLRRLFTRHMGSGSSSASASCSSRSETSRGSKRRQSER